ncbi:MAG: hypothetical protein OIN86_15495, partial [Candidatus Methanoperedens sp.]|nr:hypothetical protein [Candidatus Methanoperedens sp.]
YQTAKRKLLVTCELPLAFTRGFLLHRIPNGFSDKLEFRRYPPYYVTSLIQFGFTKDRNRMLRLSRFDLVRHSR